MVYLVVHRWTSSHLFSESKSKRLRINPVPNWPSSWTCQQTKQTKHNKNKKQIKEADTFFNSKADKRTMLRPKAHETKRLTRLNTLTVRWLGALTIRKENLVAMKRPYWYHYFHSNWNEPSNFKAFNQKCQSYLGKVRKLDCGRRCTSVLPQAAQLFSSHLVSNEKRGRHLISVAQTMDSAIHRINLYPVSDAIGPSGTYLLYSDF